ncbi:MAG: phosphoribosylformylglycinamidine synthase I [Planctomycetota bacterium]|nr:phosphoribosylformylglycinamidine synthase I [Planctomycetota bacterium]
MPRALIIRTAGTNCDVETAFAFEKAGAEQDIVHVRRLTEQPATLNDYQILALPGGFSYGDDVAAGKVFANEIKNKLGDALAEFVEAGKLVIGICNGFQVMVKIGLLPGPFSANRAEQTVTLTNNDSNKFEDRWVHLSIDTDNCVFTRGLERVYIPVAHGEGKFVAAEASQLDELETNSQIAFRYVGPDTEKRGYPWNPNGSHRDIAGICDPTGRALGLMPHPERHILPTQHPRWTREGLKEEGDGLAMFRNAVEYFA